MHISRKNLKVFQIPIEKRCLLETGAVRGYSTQFQETALWTTSSWSNDCAISQSHDGAIRFGRFCRWNGVSTEAVIFWRIAIEIFLGDPVSGDFQASNHWHNFFRNIYANNHGASINNHPKMEVNFWTFPGVWIKGWDMLGVYLVLETCIILLVKVVIYSVPSQSLCHWIKNDQHVAVTYKLWVHFCRICQDLKRPWGSLVVEAQTLFIDSIGGWKNLSKKYGFAGSPLSFAGWKPPMFAAWSQSVLLLCRSVCVCMYVYIYICIYPFGIDTARQRRLSMHFPKVQMQIGMMVCTWENTGI